VIWWWLLYLAAGYFTTCRMIETNFGGAAEKSPDAFAAFAASGLWPVLAVEMWMQDNFPVLEEQYPDIEDDQIDRRR
jgi:hypothetical protein